MADNEPGPGSSEAGGEAERGFTIIDRRGSRGEETGGGTAEEGPGPTVDFSAFVLSLGSSALYHLGLLPDPESATPAAEPNLVLARQTIDTLEMLSVKTQGNRSDEESKLLESLLYELRMRFVETRERSSVVEESEPGAGSR